ncbi:MFS transporter [Sporolactobacillus sp. STSJ-5]|nr:MFS transporter [Sporolactobacillus sp. STSJ-5]MCQ2011269.1 MFS transporter [Sporolactobacillus sp. STSJ-5]
MKISKRLTLWKNSLLLLLGIGISNIGDWIYLIALNLIVLDMTHSPLAVTVLYILKPAATLLTNFWSGSLIDRLNKRKLMIVLDLMRAGLIILLPSIPSLFFMFLVVFVINMASSMFNPASMTYITKVTPPDQRKQFNSLRGLIESGGFLIGPAIAGLLFLIGSPMFAIYINGLSFILSALVILFLPNVEKHTRFAIAEKMSLQVIKMDWQVVIQFSLKNSLIMTVYFLFSCMMVMAASVDSLEAAFAKAVLGLSNTRYGFLVSIAGAGIACGAFVTSLFARKLSISFLIQIGALFFSLGYILYAVSHSFSVAAAGFFVLSFFMAFANAGFLTFYQKSIPTQIMGRVGSLYDLIEAVLVIMTTIIFGLTADYFSIRAVVITGTIIMFVVALLLSVFTHYWTKRSAIQKAP